MISSREQFLLILFIYLFSSFYRYMWVFSTFLFYFFNHSICLLNLLFREFRLVQGSGVVNFIVACFVVVFLCIFSELVETR